MNEDERASQLSAMFDGELPAAQCELLSRRLARDEQLRATWSRYAVIGAVLRAEPVAQVRPDFAHRVSQALAAPAGARARRGNVLRSAALGSAIAAGVAGAAILMLRRELPVPAATLLAVHPAAVAPAAVLASVSAIPASLNHLQLRGPDASRFSYVVPPATDYNSAAVPASMADYVIAHSEVSSPLARGSLISVLVGNEQVRLAPDTVMAPQMIAADDTR